MYLGQQLSTVPISDEHRGAVPGAVQLGGEPEVAESALRRLQAGEGLHGVAQAHGALLVCAAQMSSRSKLEVVRIGFGADSTYRQLLSQNSSNMIPL